MQASFFLKLGNRVIQITLLNVQGVHFIECTSSTFMNVTSITISGLRAGKCSVQ